RARLARDGPNQLEADPGRGMGHAVLAASSEPMLLLLAAVAALYAIVGEWRDAAAMALSVAFVIALNIHQNVRSARALGALRDLTAPRARVVREGRAVMIPAAEVVVDDLLMIGDGDRIAADAQVLEGSAMEVDESLLTGESAPVAKATGDLLRAGTFAVQGRCIAQVIATGPRTELGRIGHSLATVSRAESPLRRQVRRLVRVFAVLSLSAAVLLTVLELVRGTAWREATLAALTFAMATVPGEFPVVFGLLFTLGAWRLARVNALVQRPDAIETLGCMTVLCTDKTGTLTENRMRVQQVLVPDAGFHHAVAAGAARESLLAVAAHACPSDAVDPMDTAVLDAAGERHVRLAPLRYYPFSAALHATASAIATTAGLQVSCKGAPETLAMLCGLDDDRRAVLDRSVAALAGRGFRVLGVAHALIDPAAGPPETLETAGLDWCGLLAIADPLRADVPDAIRRARAAGIRVVLVTGDHPETARAIAQAAGLGGDGQIRTGQEIAAASEAELLAWS
ncbi:HAD-IC family P-type ATPase, partial [Cognatilysobacter lacus]